MMEKILDVQDVNTRDMTLTGLDLTSLCHTEWMVLVQELDVSQNHLSSLKPLSNLPCLTILIANNNDIDSLEGLQHCKQLRKLHLQKNCELLHYFLKTDKVYICSNLIWEVLGNIFAILLEMMFMLFNNELCYMGWYVLNLKFSPFVTGLQTVQVFLPLSSLPLEEVNVAGNPLCNTENYTQTLRALLPSLPASWGSPRVPVRGLSNFWCSTCSEDRTDDKGQNKCDTSIIYGPVFCVQLCLYLSFIYSYISALYV